MLLETGSDAAFADITFFGNYDVPSEHIKELRRRPGNHKWDWNLYANGQLVDESDTVREKMGGKNYTPYGYITCVFVPPPIPEPKMMRISICIPMMPRNPQIDLMNTTCIADVKQMVSDLLGLAPDANLKLFGNWDRSGTPLPDEINLTYFGDFALQGPNLDLYFECASRYPFSTQHRKETDFVWIVVFMPGGMIRAMKVASLTSMLVLPAMIKQWFGVWSPKLYRTEHRMGWYPTDAGNPTVSSYADSRGNVFVHLAPEIAPVPAVANNDNKNDNDSDSDSDSDSTVRVDVYYKVLNQPEDDMLTNWDDFKAHTAIADVKVWVSSKLHVPIDSQNLSYSRECMTFCHNLDNIGFYGRRQAGSQRVEYVKFYLQAPNTPFDRRRIEPSESELFVVLHYGGVVDWIAWQRASRTGMRARDLVQLAVRAFGEGQSQVTATLYCDKTGEYVEDDDDDLLDSYCSCPTDIGLELIASIVKIRDRESQKDTAFPLALLFVSVSAPFL
jgi:hypothetical protein